MNENYNMNLKKVLRSSGNNYVNESNNNYFFLGNEVWLILVLFVFLWWKINIYDIYLNFILVKSLIMSTVNYKINKILNLLLNLIIQEHF